MVVIETRKKFLEGDIKGLVGCVVVALMVHLQRNTVFLSPHAVPLESSIPVRLWGHTELTRTSWVIFFFNKVRKITVPK